ncbi:MAG: hypothetical protein ACE5E6_05575, partial [Phycisphaerae bacterium]
MNRRGLGLILGIVAVLCSPGRPAWGQIVWHVDDDAAPGGDGQSWETAFLDLQTALGVAEPGAEIRVAAGVYRPDGASGNRSLSFNLVSGVSLLGGFAGLGGADPDARDPVLFVTTLSGDLLGDDGPDFTNTGDNSLHVVRGTGVGPTAVLDGFVVSAGNADGGAAPDGNGGGLLLNGSGSPTIRDCVFAGNSGVSSGAVYNLGGNPSFVRSRFTGNRAASLNGGAVYNTANSNGVFSQCVFIGNTAETVGGAVSAFDGNATFRSCVFLGNMATHGGGISVQGTGVVSVATSTFSQNMATTAGGGINVLTGTALVSDSILWGNTAGGGSVESAQVAGAASVNYSCVEGLDALGGIGNIGTDPLFADPGSDPPDVHVSTGSPCIDSGDPAFDPLPGETDIDGDPRVVNDRVDMGMDEFVTNDCNMNDVDDDEDIASGGSEDCNDNGTPDECEIPAETPGGPFFCITNCDPDCNENGIPDVCDTSGGGSSDCNNDAVPDECEPDCNGNGTADGCDIDDGSSV